LAHRASWIGGEAASSDIATSATALTRMGEAVATNGRAVTLFTLSAPQVVRVEARATRPGGDPVLELYDAAGALVITDDDSGGGRDSRAETELGAGAYCLLVRGFGDAAVTADIGAGRLEHEALTEGLRGGFPDPGGADGPAFVGIQPCLPDDRGQRTDARIAIDAGAGTGRGAGHQHRHRHAVLPLSPSIQPQGLSMRAQNEAADPYIYLFDGVGALIAENDDYDSLNSRIDITTPLAAGSYCMGMRALANPTCR
jgi:hypothetical protein